MRSLEPELARIREEHKNNQEEQARRTMALYKEHGVNPFSGCVMLLIQLPILIAMYQVFLLGAEDVGAYLYPFVSAPESLRTVFLGVIDLTGKSIFLAALSGLTQFVQMKLAVPTPPTGSKKNEPTNGETSQKTDISRMMTMQMTYVMPVVIFMIGLRFPAAVSLYWTTMNIFAIIHEMIVRKKAESIRMAYESGREPKNT